MTGMAYMCKNRHGTYYARFIIPKPLQSHFKNKKEIRRSLQTDSRKLAIKRARIYRVEFESIVEKLMSKDSNTVDMKFITYVDLSGITVTIDTGDDEQDIKTFKQIAPTPSDEQLALQEKRAEELHRAQLAAITASAFPAPTQPTNPKKLSAYLEDYIKHQIAPGTKGGWKSPDTQKNMIRALRIFCSEVQDKSAAAFDWSDAKQYIKLAHSIPVYFRNPSHAAKFNGLTIKAILDDSIDKSGYETRKPSAVWGDLKVVRAFLEWVRFEERVKELKDAVEALDSAIKRIDPKSKRRAFSPAELKTLFEDDNSAAENYVKGFNSKRGIDASLKYWLPLLGLYTGATIAELCQLHLSDIRPHSAFDGSNHWIIDINVDPEKCAVDEDIRLKTDARPRLIPVHKVLLDLGFIGHVQALSAKGETELFSTAKRGKGKFGPTSFGPESQWWGEHSGNAGVDSPDVVFHSFRHTLTTKLSDIHVDREVRAAIEGHAIQTIGEQIYRTGGHRNADIGPLVEALNKVDYGLKHHSFKSA